LSGSLVVIFLCLLAACDTTTTTGTVTNTPAANTPSSVSTPTQPSAANPEACSLVTADQASQILQVKASAQPAPVKSVQGATATSACTYQDSPITASATLQVIYYADSTTAKTVFEARKKQDASHNEQEVSGLGDSAFSAGDSPVLGVLQGRVILVVGVSTESAQHLLDQEIQIARDAVATLG
jgi:hypothetical protein